MSKKAVQQAIRVHAQDLYLAMPGAPKVPRDGEGFACWGDIDGTEHWLFCEAIARAIVNTSGRVHVERD